MARTLTYNTPQILADLLAYLRTPGFTCFAPSDVANYRAIDQVHVLMRHGDCERTYIFNVRKPEMLAGPCKSGHRESPPASFWKEVEALSKEFSSIVAAYSTVQVVRRRDPSLASPY